jgi:hypothetical protein
MFANGSECMSTIVVRRFCETCVPLVQHSYRRCLLGGQGADPSDVVVIVTTIVDK